MILSALALWKKYDTKTFLNPKEWGEEEVEGKRFSHLHYSGHQSVDGLVRIYAQFCKPTKLSKCPAILLLPDAEEPIDRELMSYFVDKGYAVLVPDYAGKQGEEKENYTVYPPSLAYGNYEKARGLYDMTGIEPHATTWVEWTYVALFSLKYLQEREDITSVGVVGIRKGGDIAWQVMLSPEVKCGVPINSVGWHSLSYIPKFGEKTARDLSSDVHRYIAAVEAQSYAPSVQCPVLMLCSLRDTTIDGDRAYDTYSRIGGKEGNALTYSFKSGSCIGPESLTAMDLFLEKNLKGREIYIPDTLNISLKEEGDHLTIEVDCDKEGILEEAGIFYSEADVNTKSAYRDWRRIYKTEGRTVKNGKIVYQQKPYAGASSAFAYAYAKYINGFCVTSKVVYKRLSSPNENAVKNRMLFSGSNLDAFTVANHNDYAIGNIFLESAVLPLKEKGYGDLEGVYSAGGVKTYKISAPEYLPDENAMLEFDVYSPVDQKLTVSVHVGDMEGEEKIYTCTFKVKGGGKWKRVIFNAGELKGEDSKPLESFRRGSALSFNSAEKSSFAVTNIIWL